MNSPLFNCIERKRKLEPELSSQRALLFSPSALSLQPHFRALEANMAKSKDFTYQLN